jgi:hypothetical protein
MAKAPTRPKEKDREEGEEDITVTPDAHDAPGLSPLERMTELTRRILHVPKEEADRAKRRA